MPAPEDFILSEIKETGFFPIHNGYEQSVYPALRKLKAWGIIEPSLKNTKYTLTKEGDLLIKSGKTFDQWINPPWYIKLWNILKKIFWPGLWVAARRIGGSP